MERTEIVSLGMENGIERKKISFINPSGINAMKDAQSHFTKDEKKVAKINHKNSTL